ncbi:MAG TPA: DUF5665 domain-containing protein [Candidatus Saccharimonadales bacterium]|nr:DUF5665 domain-containing protein [Candidatus Saccharimonadales bacterium]
MSSKKKLQGKAAEIDVARLADILFKADYIDKKHLYFQNFVRGITFGAGSVLGATVVIALAVWILSLFDTVPLIGPLIENTRETINQR